MKHIEIDRVTNREMRMHGDVEFPIGIYSETLSSYDLGYVPWHWHAEMEVYFIVKGILELVTTEGTIYLKSGEGFFANSNELHCMKMGEGKDVQYISIVFNPQVIRNGLPPIEYLVEYRLSEAAMQFNKTPRAYRKAED